MSRGDGVASPSRMVSAPEADSTAAVYSATAAEGLSKLPSAKQLIAAATSPRDCDLPDIGSGARRSGAGPSPKLQVDTRDTLPPPPAPYRRDHVVPISSPLSNGVQHHPSSSASRLHTLAPSPSHSHAEMEAAQRVQNEAHYYRLIDLHTGDIRSLGDALAQLDHNVRMLMRDMQDVRQELRSRGPPPVPGQAVDDRTLEVFSSNLNQVASKANEVDNVKVELALLKRKVARLEEQTQLASPASGTAQYPHREPVHPPPSAVPAHHPHHALPSIPPISTLAASHHPPERRILQTPTGPVIDYSDPRAAEQRGPAAPLSGPLSHDPETPLGAAGGWTSVNQSAKRPSDVNGRVDTSGTPLGSPKRPKLAPLEPRMPSNESIHHGSSFEDHRELPHLRPRSTDPGYDVKHPLNPHAGHHPSQEPGHDESWRIESHRPVHPYGSMGTSPTRGGRSGRGRGRRSGQEHELMNPSPEWDREGWTGSQAGPDGYYQPITPSGRGRGVLRRASGGLHHPPVAQLAQGAVLLPPGDPYAHTKKQRQKPTRNADGILIRKDGRPDMRSQSSAANLRKVHARKEEERQREWEATQAANSPSSGGGASFAHADTATGAARSVSSDSQDTGEPQSQAAADKADAQDRHEKVMKQMFPRGTEDSRARVYGLGGADTPASLSREETGESMRLDETQASTQPASKTHTPEPSAHQSTRGSPAETQDTPMEGSDATPAKAASSKAAPGQAADAAASSGRAAEAIETK